MKSKVPNKAYLVLAITACVVAVIAPLRHSMLDALVAAVGIMAVGLIWIAFSHRVAMRGVLGVQTALVLAICLLMLTGYFIGGRVAERTTFAVMVLAVACIVVPRITVIREWRVRKSTTLKSGCE